LVIAASEARQLLFLHYLACKKNDKTDWRFGAEKGSRIGGISLGNSFCQLHWLRSAMLAPQMVIFKVMTFMIFDVV
jgi:hypothetical protein